MEHAGIQIAEWINEAVDEATQELRAEITQLRAENDALREAHGEQERYLHEAEKLRAELEQERELADRLYGALEYIDDYCLAYPELESLSSVSSSAIEYVDTRRNK